MLQCSDLVRNDTKANEALTGNSIPVSAVLVKLTGMVMVMQKITKTQLVYFKTERYLALPGEGLYSRAHLARVFSVIPERPMGSIRMSNGWPSNKAKPHNGVAVAFIPKGILR